MIGWKELLIVLVIVLLIFGTKRLANIGKDLGEGVKGFKKGMGDDQDGKPPGRLETDKPEADKPDAQRHADDSVSAQDERDAGDRPRDDR